MNFISDFERYYELTPEQKEIDAIISKKYHEAKAREKGVSEIMNMSFIEFICRLNSDAMPVFVPNERGISQPVRMIANPNPTAENQKILDMIIPYRKTNGKGEQFAYELRGELEFCTVEKFLENYK
jgi:hypothetical protein